MLFSPYLVQKTISLEKPVLHPQITQPTKKVREPSVQQSLPFLAPVCSKNHHFYHDQSPSTGAYSVLASFPALKGARFHKKGKKQGKSRLLLRQNDHKLAFPLSEIVFFTIIVFRNQRHHRSASNSSLKYYSLCLTRTFLLNVFVQINVSPSCLCNKRTTREEENKSNNFRGGQVGFDSTPEGFLPLATPENNKEHKTEGSNQSTQLIFDRPVVKTCRPQRKTPPSRRRHRRNSISDTTVEISLASATLI